MYEQTLKRDRPDAKVLCSSDAARGRGRYEGAEFMYWVLFGCYFMRWWDLKDQQPQGTESMPQLMYMTENMDEFMALLRKVGLVR